MKRLFLFFLILGAFFCFDKANADTYQLFTNPASLTETITYSWSVNWQYDDQVIQEFSPEQSGLLTHFTIRAGSETARNLIYISNGTNTSSCTWETIDYDRCYLNTPLSVNIGQKIEIRKSFHSTGNPFYYAKSPSTTYTNIYGFDNAYRKTSGASPYKINFDFWVKYNIEPLPNSNFYIDYPAQNEVFEYLSEQNIGFVCYNSSSQYAIYYDDEYLMAEAEDFKPCQNSGFNFLNFNENLAPYVSETFTVNDGERKIVILDKNYLTSSSSAYIRELKYFGALDNLSLNKISLSCPLEKTSYGTYIMSSTPDGVIIQGIYTTKDPGMRDDITVYWRSDESNEWTEVDTITANSMEYYTQFGGWVWRMRATTTGFSQYKLDMDGLTSRIFTLEGSERIDVPANNRCNYTTTTITEEEEAEKTIYQGEICNNTCWKNGLLWNATVGFQCWWICKTIVPEKLLSGKLPPQLIELRDTLVNYPPFGYFFAYNNAIMDMPSSSATTTSGWEELGDIWLIEEIRRILGYIVYILGIFAIFKLFRKFI